MIVGPGTHALCIAVALGFGIQLAPFALLWGLYWGVFVSAFYFSLLLYVSSSDR
jgi:hypothetical protein